MSKEWGTRDLLIEVYKQDGLFGLLSVALFSAFSKKQKDYISARDDEFGIKTNKGGCQFPGEHRCNGDVKTPQIHHSIPQKYAHEVLGIDPDQCRLGIKLCENSHQNLVHPDMIEARRNYGRDKKSFEKVFEQRRQLLKQGRPYWDTTWDRQFYLILERTNQRARNAGWVEPEASVKRKKHEKVMENS